MRRGDWVLVLVFILLHLAAAVIRGCAGWNGTVWCIVDAGYDIGYQQRE